MRPNPAIRLVSTPSYHPRTHWRPDERPPVALNILLSDFVVNSLGFAYFDAGLLHRTLTDKDVPAGIPVRLNTKSFEEGVPPLCAKHPDRMMTVDVHSPQSPAAQLVEGKIIELVGVELGFNVLAGQSPSRAFVLAMNTQSEVALQVDGSVVKGHAALVQFQMSVKESSVGPLDVGACKELSEVVVGQRVMKRVNDKLEKGFVVPAVEGFQLVKTSVSIKSGYIALCSNVALYVQELPPFGYDIEQALRETGNSEGEWSANSEAMRGWNGGEALDIDILGSETDAEVGFSDGVAGGMDNPWRRPNSDCRPKPQP